jgi:SAM-dependent methyltransferase
LNHQVLEYGFGHGHALFWFGPSASLRGIEISDSAIAAAEREARRRGFARSEFKKPPDDDPIRIDYPTNSFDVVICSHTIEHVYNDGGLISELYRVLTPGGKCFLLVPQDVYRRGLLDDVERRRPDFPAETIHVWRYNLDSFLHLVQAAGFRDLEARSLDAFWGQRESLWRPLQIMCSLAFVALPYRVWEWVDRRSLAKGYEPKQILVVATKEFAQSGMELLP